eukprot:COSAG01_NODE_28366_length_662_cov_32.902309_1_plen_99_part_10
MPVRFCRRLDQCPVCVRRDGEFSEKLSSRRPPYTDRALSDSALSTAEKNSAQSSSEEIQPSAKAHPAAFFEEIVICCRFQNRSLQPQAESGSCVVLSGH